MREPQQNPVSLYGWGIVIIIALANRLIYFGVSQGNLCLFSRPLFNEYPWCRGPVATRWPLIHMSRPSLVELIGPARDRSGPRPVRALGIRAGSEGFLHASVASPPCDYYGFSSSAALAECSLRWVPTQVSLSSWFPKRRLPWTGIATSGVSLNGTMGPMVTTSIIEYTKWRAAFLCFGIGCLPIARQLVTGFTRHRPKKFGLCPDSVAPTDSHPATSIISEPTDPLVGSSSGSSLRTVTSRALTPVSTGMFHARYGNVRYLVLLITDRDFTTSTVARL